MQAKDAISAAVCEFYDVDLPQMRGSGRALEIVIARCALATELATAGCAVSEIAQYMHKTDTSVRAMLEQYEQRAAAAGLPVFVMPVTETEPEPDDAEETAKPAPGPSREVRARLILDRLLRDAGGPLTPDSGDPMPPLYGLTDSEAQSIARLAHSEPEVHLSDIADFYGINVRKVVDWLSTHENGAPETKPIEVAQKPESVDKAPDDVLDVPRFVGIAAESRFTGRVPDGVERIYNKPTPPFHARGEQTNILHQSAPQPAPEVNLLDYIDRADLYRVAQFLVCDHSRMPEKLSGAVQRILMSLVDAAFDSLPPPKSDAPRMLPPGFDAQE